MENELLKQLRELENRSVDNRPATIDLPADQYQEFVEELKSEKPSMSPYADRSCRWARRFVKRYGIVVEG